MEYLDLQKARLAIARLAEKEHVTCESITSEIEFAIDVALNNADKAQQAFWEALPTKGPRPTAEELIAYLVNAVIEKSGLSL